MPLSQYAKLAEVVVGAHLAAVHGIFQSHAFLDERVTGLALNRHAAGGVHHVRVFQVSRGSWMIFAPG
jgi:ABC-type uncharacterized transport system permease subunit